jgi:sensor domain CHASE-containing protein
MEILKDYKDKSAEEIWGIVTEFIDRNQFFHSVRGIKYEAEVRNDSIYYKGGKGKRGVSGESIIQDEFCDAYDNVKNLSNINTNSIKDCMPQSIYAQRTPFIGLLLSSQIIQK